LKAYCFLCIS